MDKATNTAQILDLLDRLSRIGAAEHWVGDLNPAQIAALNYLSKANRHSRAPSQIAEFLSAMRGTVSGTLKALARKELIEEQKSQTDKRRTSYNITAKGQHALNFKTAIDQALDNLSHAQKKRLDQSLKTLVTGILKARQDRSFGICASCRYNRKDTSGNYCTLLEIALKPSELSQICFEHQ